MSAETDPVAPDLAIPPTVAQLRRDDAAWDAFVAGSSTPFHLQQTPWAVSKRPNGWTSIRVVADGGSGPIGAQVLVRKLGPGPFAVGYAARGPVTRCGSQRRTCSTISSSEIEVVRPPPYAWSTHSVILRTASDFLSMRFAGGRWK